MICNASREPTDNLPRDCQTSNQLKIKVKPGSAPPWTSYLLSCLEQGAFCDVFLECDDALVGAHKIILASASSHLSDLLQGISQDQATILLPGISKQILQLYLRLVYGQTIVMRKNILEELLVKFRGIDVALGIANLRLSKRNAQGNTDNDLDLSENIRASSSANNVRCASCDSEITQMALDLDTLLEMNAGDEEMEENLTSNNAGDDEMEVNQSQIQQTEGEGLKAVREVEGENSKRNNNSFKIHRKFINDECVEPISMSSLQRNDLENFVGPNATRNQIVKPIKSLSNKEKTYGIIGKKVISKNEDKKVKKKLEKVVKKTILSKKRHKKALQNLKESSVEVLIKNKEHFNKDTLRQVERLKSAPNSVFCQICLKEFSSDKQLNSHSKVHKKDLGTPTVQTDRVVDLDYARPIVRKTKVRFNCKTWNLPSTLLLHEGGRCFTCATCKRRVFGRERANYHVYESHYLELCTLGGDYIPKEIKPDFSNQMLPIETFAKDKDLPTEAFGKEAKIPMEASGKEVEIPMEASGKEAEIPMEAVRKEKELDDSLEKAQVERNTETDELSAEY